MAEEFYDGKKRPILHIKYTVENLNRTCLNCGRRFGEHYGYDCKSKNINTKKE